MSKISWDENETILLIDACERVNEYKESRRNVESELSNLLRKYAIDKGLEIDDIYRNTNGIHMQMLAMENVLYSKNDSFKKASKLFHKYADIYKSNRQLYDSLLIKAKRTVNMQDNIYMTWLKEHVSDTKYPRYKRAYSIISSYYQKKGVIDCDVIEVNDLNQIEQIKKDILKDRRFKQEYQSDISDCMVSLNYLSKWLEINILKLKDNTNSEKIENDNRILFQKWLIDESGIAQATVRSYTSAISRCEEFAKENHFVETNIYDEKESETVKKTILLLLHDEDFIELNKTKHNRYSGALKKYLEFLNVEISDEELNRREKRKTKTKSESIVINRKNEVIRLLTDFFPKGIRINSFIDIRKFKRYWTQEYPSYDLIEEELLRQILSDNCFIYNDIAYLPTLVMDDELCIEIKDFINSSFEDGSKAIYYSVLFDTFNDKLQNTFINDVKMFREFLKYRIKDGLCYTGTYITNSDLPKIEISEDVKEFLIACGMPMQVEAIYDALSSIPQEKIFWTIAGHNSEEFIRNKKGEYFHEAIIELSDEELKFIKSLIDEGIHNNRYISGTSLINNIYSAFPDLKEKYSSYITDIGMRDAIAYKLRHDYSFKGNIISDSDDSLTMTEIFEDFAKRKKEFTLLELKNFANELESTSIYFEPIYSNAIRIDKDNFCSMSSIDFSVDEIDTAISRFIVTYGSFKDIVHYGTFPYEGVPWNEFLLQSFILNYSKRFKILNSNLNESKAVGAIVDKTSGFDTFEDVVFDLLLKLNTDLNTTVALQYLCDLGYIARRKYTNIEDIVNRINDIN